MEDIYLKMCCRTLIVVRIHPPSHLFNPQVKYIERKFVKPLFHRFHIAHQPFVFGALHGRPTKDLTIIFDRK